LWIQLHTQWFCGTVCVLVRFQAMQKILWFELHADLVLVLTGMVLG
jgi:hypothetical protein